MRKIIILLVIVVSALVTYSQEAIPLPLAKFDENINQPLTLKERSFIDEVYGNYATEFIYDNPHRLKVFKQILRNRIIIEYHKNKDFSSLTPLSQVPLINSINPNLKRDFNFDKDNFNPLKYAFNFFSRNQSKSYYRVDNQQYLITILPQY